MNDYLSNAAKVVCDPEQTSVAKATAIEILRNAGFTQNDIEDLSDDSQAFINDHMIFFA